MLDWNTDVEAVGRFNAHYDSIPGIVRVRLLARQVTAAVGPGASVLDVGSGRGDLGLALSRDGCRTTLADPSPLMAQAHRELAASEAIAPLEYLQIPFKELPGLGRTFDAVLCHGVAMYMEDAAALFDALGQLVAPQGVVSVLTKNSTALAMRPGLQRDFTAAVEAFRLESGSRGWLGHNTLGLAPDALVQAFHARGFAAIAWYGIGVFTDHWLGEDAEQRPAEAEECSDVVEAEFLASARDPYRGIARLIHYLGRKT